MTEKQNTSASVRYAQVLYELPVSEHTVAETKRIWRDSEELRKVLESVAVERQKKRSIIERVFPGEIQTFLKVVSDHGKMGSLDGIFGAYEKKKNEEKGILEVKLRYVNPPDEEQKQRMEAFLLREYHASGIQWEWIQDESLIGGFILLVNGREYDYSVLGRIDRLEQRLSRR